MPSLPIILMLVVVFAISIGVTLLAVRLFRSKEQAEVPEHVKREATDLRKRVARLGTGQEDIEERARRLEQMLTVKRKDQ